VPGQPMAKAGVLAGPTLVDTQSHFQVGEVE
jgi:hypothetical protein